MLGEDLPRAVRHPSRRLERRPAPGLRERDHIDGALLLHLEPRGDRVEHGDAHVTGELVARAVDGDAVPAARVRQQDRLGVDARAPAPASARAKVAVTKAPRIRTRAQHEPVGGPARARHARVYEQVEAVTRAVALLSPHGLWLVADGELDGLGHVE